MSPACASCASRVNGRGLASVMGLSGAYTTYTPTLAGATSGPTLGSGASAEGFYKWVGTQCWGNARIGFGESGTDAGVGAYGFELPVVPVNVDRPVGTARIVMVSDESRFVLCALAMIPSFFFSAASKRAVMFESNVAAEGLANGHNPVGPTIPSAWGAFDNISVEFDYETATAAP